MTGVKRCWVLFPTIVLDTQERYIAFLWLTWSLQIKYEG